MHFSLRGASGKGRFVTEETKQVHENRTGRLAWVAGPLNGAENLVVLEAEVNPGHGRDFHRQAEQEKVIFVISGQLEQWIEGDMQILQAGDSVYVNKGVVNASFCFGDEPVKFLTVLSPCLDGVGFQIEDVSQEEPWRTMRGGR